MSAVHRALRAASELGHTLGDFDYDGRHSLVAECIYCERIVGVDAGEFQGRAVTVPCDHSPVSAETRYCRCLACSVEGIAG